MNYNREFNHYYSSLGIDNIRKKVCSILESDIPEKILLHCTAGIESKYSKLNLFLEVLYNFYMHLYNTGYKDILGLYEACIGSTAHSLYHVAGATRVGITNNNLGVNNTYMNVVSDIFVHEKIVPSVIESFNLPVKQFMKKNSNKMREVLNR